MLSDPYREVEAQDVVGLGLDSASALAAARATQPFRAVYERSQPLVSVCVATANRSDLLVDRCVASLLRQTYRNLQVVVVGDHCIDDTARRMAAVGDERVTFVNLGVRGPYPRRGRARWLVAGTHAMNEALRLAEGDFVCHLDDDDQAMATRLERLVEAACTTRAEFLWHQFSWDVGDGLWKTLGLPEPRLGHITSGSIFYHRVFTETRWDPLAYRSGEPGDWHRVKRIRALAPVEAFVPAVLTLHYCERTQLDFVPQDGELFFDDEVAPA